MNPVKVTETLLKIPVYPEGEPEALPIFAENRVHQRTLGNPYPNAVTIDVRTSDKPAERELEAIVIENDYIAVTLLPGFGGRVFSAVDKTTGKDMFYRQHVIKPALIGMLGSWISGGIEFNWPTHHRPSTYLPVDHFIEENNDETIVWLSEHEVCDHMLGTVGIALRPDRTYFETRVRLYNRTPLSHSFLWWENAAIPAGPGVRLFFPQDVDHVFFHYKRNTASFPINGGWFNGHHLPENTDISRHENTRFPTSYFSAASEFDFFGGYDERSDSGVVHIADHHISPGKKMFTWAYNQLAKTWENALTDTDGAYLELMAGSYSDNQPDFSWLAPYEEKRFSQFWYPISETGAPCYANLDLSVSLGENELIIKPTGSFGLCRVTVSDGDGVLLDTDCELSAAKNLRLAFGRERVGELRITVRSAEKILADYTTIKTPANGSAPVIEGYPTPDECRSTEEAYLTGVHIVQYRDPAADPEKYFERAIELSGDNYEAYTALAECELKRGALLEAYGDIKKAWELLTMRNAHPQSGRTAYLYGYIAAVLGYRAEAEKAYWSAYFSADCKDAALIAIASLEGQREDFEAQYRHSRESRAGMNADCIKILAENRLAPGKTGTASELREKLAEYPYSQTLRWAAVCCGALEADEFYALLGANPSQTCIDIYDELTCAGLDREARGILEELERSGKPYSCMVDYLLGKTPADRELCRVFPFRESERKALERAYGSGDPYAGYLLGCLLCGRGEYENALVKFEDCGLPEGIRGAAVCLWKLENKRGAFERLCEAHRLLPESRQIIWELLRVGNSLGVDYSELREILDSLDVTSLRDDIYTEYALALCRGGMAERAVGLLEGHSYIPCEGGEGAVADVWIKANSMLADERFKAGDFADALRLYEKAENLPDNLGSGYWNDAKRAPLWYSQGLCLEKLGRADEARERFERITALLTDFFSDMALPELDIYKLRAFRKLGDGESALRTAKTARERWERELARTDSGFFATTPFFDSYHSKTDAKLERTERFGRLLRELERVL